MKWFVSDNINGLAGIEDIPIVPYALLRDNLIEMLANPAVHIGNYFAYRDQNSLKFLCLVLDDSTGRVMIAGHQIDYYGDPELESIAAVHPQMHVFEREMSELFGIRFLRAPWDKPLRYPHDAISRGRDHGSYPFYQIDGDSLHEVNVGPIHAGIIEPGAFRFICNGERVLHLEIALGYQHRGIETLILGAGNHLRRTVLCESVAGDSAVSHAVAHATVAERLGGVKTDENTILGRAIAIEMERIAMHIADSGALCMDIGYQTGQVACEALRTLVINATQRWCGNRFGKGLVRTAGTYYPINRELAEDISSTLKEVVSRYRLVREDMKSTQSLLARFEDCGSMSREQMLNIGAVGQGARASGLVRDIRKSHPYGPFENGISHEPELKTQGDVMARLMLRGREIFQSADYIEKLILRLNHSTESHPPDYDFKFAPGKLAFSFVEGWRGEICHTAVTGKEGELISYKIKDPSMHNWLALAIAVRGEGISDFPICNKSFNLSYCGHDL